MNIISEFMEEDHDRLDNIFAEFQKKKREDPVKAMEMFLEFSQGLRRHIGWEDDTLFSLFESRMNLPGGPTAVMRMEHGLIKDYLAQIQSSAGGETEEIERALAAALDSHNMKEEKILYPWIDQAVPEAERRRALETIRR